MKLKVYNGDFPLVLIRASAVRDIFDQRDLETRQNSGKPVLDEYHENWIHRGVILVPSFNIKGNVAKVGMGRHRFVMQSRHMKEVPAAFERDFSKSDDLEVVYEQIVIRDMSIYEEFEYPNLPIRNLGKDCNSGFIDWKNYVNLKIALESE